MTRHSTPGQPTRQQPHGRAGSPRGASAIETVGVMAAIVMLLSAVAPVLGTWGDGRTAAAVSGVLRDAIAAPADAGGAGTGTGRGEVGARPHGPGVLHSTRHAEGRLVREHGMPVGDDLAPRVLVTNRAARRWLWEGGSHGAHGVRHGSAMACVVCGAASGRAATSLGGGRTSEGRAHAPVGGHGIAAEGWASAYLALLHAEGHASGTLFSRVAAARAQVGASGDVGASSAIHATLVASRRRQALLLGGDAVAGAVARAEARASLDLAGVALQQTAGVEGWAGAGATGRLHLERDGGRVTVGGRLGGAFGLGGALDVTTTIDATRLLGGAGRSATE